MKYPMFVVYWKKKTDYDSNISDIENKCNVKISGTEKKKKKSTAGYNKSTKDIVGDNIKRKNLVDKSDISEFKNNAGLDKKK